MALNAEIAERHDIEKLAQNALSMTCELKVSLWWAIFIQESVDDLMSGVIRRSVTSVSCDYHVYLRPWVYAAVRKGKYLPNSDRTRMEKVRSLYSRHIVVDLPSSIRELNSHGC